MRFSYRIINLCVSYASRALTKTEQRYAQVEKELYACVFAYKRFYIYIYSLTDITIETDDKPLISIIKKPVVDAQSRLQRMLLRLQPYTFKLIYTPGKQLLIADTLSRAYLPVCDHNANDECDVDAFEAIHFVSSRQLNREMQFHLLQK